MSGQFIVHDLGSARLLKAADAFFASCLRRISSQLPANAKYEPWMSCPERALDIVRSGILPKYNSPLSVLDFRPEYSNSFCDLASDKAPVSAFVTDYGAKHCTIDTDFSKNIQSVSVFQRAYELCQYWPEWLKLIQKRIHRSIFPLKAVDKGANCLVNFSQRSYIGATFHSVPSHLSFPDLSLNVSFAHELGHQALFIFEQSRAINFENDTPLYSGIRRTHRPPRNVLHAAVALSYMIESVKALQKHEKRVDRSAFLSGLLMQYREGLHLTATALEKGVHSEFCRLIINDTKSCIAD